MVDYDEKSDVFDEMEGSETKVVEILKETEEHDFEVDERVYGINKPTFITIKAIISHDKN